MGFNKGGILEVLMFNFIVLRGQIGLTDVGTGRPLLVLESILPFWSDFF